MKPFEVVLLVDESLVSAMAHAVILNFVGFLCNIGFHTGWLFVLGIMDYFVFYKATNRREHIRKIIEGEEANEKEHSENDSRQPA